MTTPTNDSETTRRIVSDLDANFIVEAGAGTGKTYALVSRVIALVKDGVAMPNIVAITFTEAAAAELSERIRSRMEQLLDDEHPDNAKDLLYENLTDAQRERIRIASNELDQASIQTIHSFAAQLLRERPLDAGLPPGWTPLDDVESREHFSDRWDEWLDEALGKDCADVDLQSTLRYLLESKIGINNWRTVAKSFSDNYDHLGNDDSISSIDLIAATHNTLEQLQKLSKECKNPQDNLMQQMDGAIATVQAIQNTADNPIEAVSALNSGSEVDHRGNVGSQGNWQRPPVSVREEFRSIGRVFQATVKAAPLIPLLHNLRQRFAVDYAARRKANGMATFDDLLIWARDLLRDNPDARAHFQQKYARILIDEFQDTDPLQAEIAFYLAAAADANIGSDANHWHTLPLKPGKLFIVGDDKQSIYRFRNADIAVVQQVKDGGQLERLTISENRRSQQPVLDWVNAVFGGPDADGPDADRPDASEHLGRLMQLAAGVQAQYVPLQPNADIQQDGLGSVQVFGGPQDIDDNAATVSRKQARHIAGLIATYAGDGADRRLGVYDKAQQNRRRADLGDVCILIRSRTGLNILTGELENAGIPYRLEGSSLYFDAQEVPDLLNCLRAIDDPSDAVSVAAALRAPAFACSDADLLRWREAGGRWNYMGDLPDTESSVRDGMLILREYHAKSRTAKVAPLIADFIRERRLDELDLDPAERRPREIWRRRQFLTEQARRMEYDAAAAGGTPLTLRRFLQWAATQQDENARIVEAPVPEADDDAVRIMTMHAAKGLEFPIVILTGIAANPSIVSKPALFGTPSGTAEVKAGDLQTPGYDGLKELERNHSAAEEIRLAYVGATRARDHLLVSMYQATGQGSRQDKGIVAQIADLPNRAVLPHQAAPDAVSAGRIQTPPDSAIVDAGVAGVYEPEVWQSDRKKDIAKRSHPQAVTATRLARAYGADAAAVESKEVAPEAEHSGKRGRGGTAFGSAIHAVLQDVVERMMPQLPLDAAASADDFLTQWNDTINRAAQRHAASEGLSDSGEVANLARQALRNPAVVAGLRAPCLWPEIPVAARLGDAPDSVVLEGIIDLLYEDNAGGLVILDYKSDYVRNDAEIRAKMSNYQWQGAAYAAAIERATGKPIRAVQFLFIRADAVQTVDDWRELMQRLAGQSSALAG